MKRLALLSSVLFAALLTATTAAQDNAETKYVWNLGDLYSTPQAWQAAFTEVNRRISEIPHYKGTLGKNAKSLRTALTTISDTYKETVRVYVYASLSRDEDQRVPEAQSRFGQARQLFSDFSEATAWVNPEILKVGEKKVTRFLKQDQGLEKFRFQLMDTLRQAPHTLDDKGEALLAQASLILSAPEQIYENYANADIPWPTVTLSDGTQAKLDQAGYTRWRGVANRDDRKLVFDTFWKAWEQYGDGMGATLASEVQANVFEARARNFDSVLAKNLFDDGLPPEVYTQLVAQVNKALPIFYRYLKLRGKMLGVKDLRYYDIYPPIVQFDTGVFTVERSKEIALQALAPFGKTYLNLLSRGFSENWMHSHPQTGKTSGAYMNGSAYDVHPYLLLNHNDDYESLSTFVHEWGHAVHTLLADANNPWETADYSTFIAEMASTINEILLQEYMIKNAKSKEEKLFYLGNALENLRGTLFRQTMFAEFELEIHEAAEKGEPLTGPKFTEMYDELLKRYHGHDQGVLTIDDAYAVEWAYIPHFYYDFYVFQYATSITGAAWFAEQFLAGDEAVKDAFIRVLKAGGSNYPHNILLHEAGLDMTKPEAYAPVMRRMTSLMDRIEELLQ